MNEREDKGIAMKNKTTSGAESLKQAVERMQSDLDRMTQEEYESKRGQRLANEQGELAQQYKTLTGRTLYYD